MQARGAPTLRPARAWVEAWVVVRAEVEVAGRVEAEVEVRVECCPWVAC